MKESGRNHRWTQINTEEEINKKRKLTTERTETQRDKRKGFYYNSVSLWLCGVDLK